MFYQPAVYCYKCCKETQHYNGDCGICKEKERQRAHKEHFAKLDTMTLEERIRRLELNEYHMSKNPPWIKPTC
jgi:hypothetical protein